MAEDKKDQVEKKAVEDQLHRIKLGYSPSPLFAGDFRSPADDVGPIPQPADIAAVANDIADKKLQEVWTWHDRLWRMSTDMRNDINELITDLERLRIDLSDKEAERQAASLLGENELQGSDLIYIAHNTIGYRRDKKAFGITWVQDFANTIFVAAGSVVLHDAAYDFGADSLLLTGSTSYVYVYIGKEIGPGTTPGIAQSASFPLSNGSQWKWPLARFDASAGSYTLTQILHEGNIYAFSPIK